MPTDKSRAAREPWGPARKVLACLMLPLVSGCMSDGLPYGLESADNFGEANRQTMAAQVIDPDPVYEYAVPETSALHAAQAAERYHNDRVKQPEKVRTSSVGSSRSN